AVARLVTGETKPAEKQAEFASSIRSGASNGSHLGLSTIIQEGFDRRQTLIIVVDQFEETYILCKPVDANDEKQIALCKQEREGFVKALLAAATSDIVKVAVLFVLRSDFFGSLAEHPEISKLIAANSEIVPSMDRHDLARVIVEPSKKAGWPIDQLT